MKKKSLKLKKRFGDAFDREQFVTTNPRVLEYKKRGEEILHRLGKSLEKEDLADVKALIEELEIADPETGSRNWTDVKQFNLMFRHQNRRLCRCLYGFILASRNRSRYFR